MASKVHLRHKELHSARDVIGQNQRGSVRQLVSLLRQKGGQPIRFFRLQDQNVIVSNRIFRCDLHPKGRCALPPFQVGLPAKHTFGCLNDDRCFKNRRLAARIEIVVFDQPGRGVAVQMRNDLRIHRIDLVTPQHTRRWHDHREIFWSAPIIRRHGDNRLSPIAHENDLRRLIVKRAVCLRDIKPAERLRTQRQAKKYDQVKETHPKNPRVQTSVKAYHDPKRGQVNFGVAL